MVSDVSMLNYLFLPFCQIKQSFLHLSMHMITNVAKSVLLMIHMAHDDNHLNQTPVWTTILILVGRGRPSLRLVATAWAYEQDRGGCFPKAGASFTVLSLSMD